MKNFFTRVIEKIKHEKIRSETQRLNFEYGLNKNKRDNKIIVSLTTFPQRIDKLDLCIKSILHQTIKPDKIIIYLGKDCSKEIASNYLNKYIDFGVEIRVDSNYNLKSHKKYFYAMREFDDALIITIDDDLIYPKDMIESLYKTYKKYPNCIVARRVHWITWNNENINPYEKWLGEYKKIKEPSYNLFATTGAGTLFPPNALYKDALDIDKIKEYAYTADDVWLKFMSILNKTKVVWAKNNLQMPTTINNSQNFSLMKENVENKKNDRYILKIMNAYGINKKNFGL